MPSAKSMPPIKRTKFKLTNDELLEIYHWLKLIRAFDERLSLGVRQGKVRSGVYTGIGQERSSSARVSGCVRATGFFPLHRDLGALLMRGDTRQMMAQMYAKENWAVERGGLGAAQRCQRARHLREHQQLGANLPVAAGVALTMKMRGPTTCARLLGEGASNTGDFHEAMNFAGVNKLPVIFICENNLYAYSVPIEKSMAVEDVAVRAEGYGFDGVAINGNDVLAVYQATKGARCCALAGQGPTLIECKTYRWHGHSEHDKAFYRTKEELAMWKSRDPLTTFTTYLEHMSVLPSEKGQEIEQKIKDTLDDAVRFAEDSPTRRRKRPSPISTVSRRTWREDFIPGSDSRSAVRRNAPRSEGVRPRRGRWSVRRSVWRHRRPRRGVRRSALSGHADL